MYGLLEYDNIWSRWYLRVQQNVNIERIAFKVVQIKFLAMQFFAEFSAAIILVFSVSRSFRIHYNMPIFFYYWCWKQFKRTAFIFNYLKVFTVTFDHFNASLLNTTSNFLTEPNISTIAGYGNISVKDLIILVKVKGSNEVIS